MPTFLESFGRAEPIRAFGEAYGTVKAIQQAPERWRWEQEKRGEEKQLFQEQRAVNEILMNKAKMEFEQEKKKEEFRKRDIPLSGLRTQPYYKQLYEMAKPMGLITIHEQSGEEFITGENALFLQDYLNKNPLETGKILDNRLAEITQQVMSLQQQAQNPKLKPEDQQNIAQQMQLLTQEQSQIMGNIRSLAEATKPTAEKSANIHYETDEKGNTVKIVSDPITGQTISKENMGRVGKEREWPSTREEKLEFEREKAELKAKEPKPTDFDKKWKIIGEMVEVEKGRKATQREILDIYKEYFGGPLGILGYISKYSEEEEFNIPSPAPPSPSAIPPTTQKPTEEPSAKVVEPSVKPTPKVEPSKPTKEKELKIIKDPGIKNDIIQRIKQLRNQGLSVSFIKLMLEEVEVDPNQFKEYLK